MSTGMIAVDIGTGSARALLVDENLNTRAASSIPLALDIPGPGMAEQDPDEVLHAVMACIRRVALEAKKDRIEPAGICIGAAVSSLVLTGTDGAPAAPAAIWADRRAMPQARRLQELLGTELYRRSGCPVHATYLPAKLAWWRDVHPETLQGAAKAVSLKEYVLHHLCGTYAIDHAMACATGLVNLNNLDWDEVAIEAAGIRRSQLPEILPTTAVARLRKQAAAELGVSNRLPVIVGASDGVLSNLGSGAVREGQVVTMVGSSGAVRMTIHRPWLDPEQRTWCYPMVAPEVWVAGGGNNTGGLVLQWLADEVLGQGGQADHAALLRRARSVPAGAEGLVFHAAIMGERSPLWDEAARGVLFGLSERHTADHIIRAAVEGIAYSLHSIYRVLRDGLGEAIDIRTTGGLANSEDWVQIQAAVFGRELLIPEQREGSALGAAILGWTATGHFRDLEEGARKIRVGASAKPDPLLGERYERLLEIHSAIYERLKDLFSKGYYEVGR
jgi:gluconokinase